ncbi:hypothetical protein RD110_10895 [Rhodoferax koreense]|uniref:DnaT DNA-binding domain-containing protein n=1 Tax=Rhodoferax koreensis TaxID=1842727 RepID=A0A1P8JV62_9BURK|nr:hypothetical protein [Rhodoferax koreense]APW37634.1 hypothetical protein RD110_10895 [Rhodoferax koreense]
MARARNIKPGFFKNEILGVADPLYSLLFEGLWILADRAGKLEDRPLRIKAEVFPYRDGLDIEAMLTWLQDQGFIRRYVVAGKRYILVLEFVKHQNPHKNETESEIPDPEEIGTKPELIGSTRADPGFLIPDSLIPDSLNSDSLLPAAAAPAQRATRLPADWVLPMAWGEWTVAEFPGWKADFIRNEAAKFADFWRAKSGKDATKLDWQATWRNWCRNAKPPGRSFGGAVSDSDRAAANAQSTADAARILGFDNLTPETIDAEE